MEVQALTKYVRMSDKKLRDVSREIQGMKVPEAIELLKLIPRKSARLILKSIQSAVANAENNFDLSSDSLIVFRCLIEQGPSIRRFRPAARGSAHPFRKHMSHIRVILTEQSISK